MDDDMNFERSSKSKKKKQKNKAKSNRRWSDTGWGDFKCVHCGQHVSSSQFRSGVRNRNHCPYCLWSRHVDLNTAGDRLAACKGGMRPVALTLKKTRKKYGEDTGEMMLVHECTECGKISINRIAADDDAPRIVEVFDSSHSLDPELKNHLEAEDIDILHPEDRNVVLTQLFGKSYIEQDKEPDDGDIS